LAVEKITTASRLKVIISGHVVEVYEYEKPVWFGFDSLGGRNHEGDEERKDEYRQQRNMRCRREIIRLATSNFDVEGCTFATFTFAENLTNVRLANAHFKRFIQRLRRRYGDFKYLAVIEFQKRGAVHYHCIFTIPYIPNAELRDVWSHGFVKITAAKHVDNIGAYVVKYMTKNAYDERLDGQKAYLTSRNLEKPVELTGTLAQKVVDNMLRDKKEERL